MDDKDTKNMPGEELGKYARHPLRTAGAAFLAGSVMGLGVMAAKKNQHRGSLQKFLDQL
jgi:hypothetical protein